MIGLVPKIKKKKFRILYYSKINDNFDYAKSYSKNRFLFINNIKIKKLEKKGKELKWPNGLSAEQLSFCSL